MCNLNAVQLIGNLGRDPEKVERKNATESQKGTLVKLSLATNERCRNARGEWETKPEWHKIYLFDKTADFALNYLKKGDKAMVIGKLRNSRWKDKEGIERYSTAVYARECQAFFNKPKTDATDAENESALITSEASNAPDDNQDDIPF